MDTLSTSKVQNIKDNYVKLEQFLQSLGLCKKIPSEENEKEDYLYFQMLLNNVIKKNDLIILVDVAFISANNYIIARLIQNNDIIYNLYYDCEKTTNNIYINVYDVDKKIYIDNIDDNIDETLLNNINIFLNELLLYFTNNIIEK